MIQGENHGRSSKLNAEKCFKREIERYITVSVIQVGLVELNC